MIAATLLAVAVVCAGFVGRRKTGPVHLLLLSLLAFAPLLAVAWSLWSGSNRSRTRVDVGFIGYQVPWDALRVVGAPDDPAAGPGVWIGGGTRWSDDAHPDLVALAGMRGHLVEIRRAASGEPGAIELRCSRPGMEFDAGEGPARVRLVPAAGNLTQRVILEPALEGEREGAGAARSGLRGPAAQGDAGPEGAVDFVRDAWSGDRAAEARRSRGTRTGPFGLVKVIRRKLLAPSDPPPRGAAVFCLAGQGPYSRWASTDFDPASATFVWREARRTWGVLPPGAASALRVGGDGAAGRTAIGLPQEPFALRVPEIADGAALTERALQALPGVSIRTITRRTLGIPGDSTASVPSDSMFPAPFQLTRPATLRFARFDSTLVILAPEPSIQLRMDDLFGGSRTRVPEGEFDLCFGDLDERRELVIDLAAQADALRPKPAFKSISARLKIDENDPRAFSISVLGAPAIECRFGDAVALPISIGGGAGGGAGGSPGGLAHGLAPSPIVVIRKVGIPEGILVLPFAAGALLLLGVFVCGRPQDPRYVVAGLITFFLVVRFALTARVLMTDPGALRSWTEWLVAGCYPLLAAPILFVVSSLPTLGSLSGTSASLARMFQPRVRNLFGGGSPTPEVRDGDPFGRDAGKRLTPAALLRAAPALAWLVAAACCAGIWLVAETRADLRLVFDVAGTLGRQGLAFALAVAAGVLAFTAVGRLARTGTASNAARAASSDPFSSGPGPANRAPTRRSRPLMLLGVGAGLLLLAARLAFLAFGYQESLPFGLKWDVIYLPMAAGAIAALFDAAGPSTRSRVMLAVLVLWFLAFPVAGFLVNDLGLAWVGAIGLVLALPLSCRDGQLGRSLVFAGLIFALFFVLPKLGTRAFLWGLDVMSPGETLLASGGGEDIVSDPLRVNRDRDYYRMMDALRPEEVERIPSRLAREVAVERHRIRYQALDGAWREGFRSAAPAGSSWFGAGFLQARPIVGEQTFRRAARSDYVFPLFVRSELGSMGLVGLVWAYLALLFAGTLGMAGPRAEPRAGRALWSPSLGAWALSLGIGSALFMIGGTNDLFPFSGKWPLFLALGSGSDAVLGLSLAVLAALRREAP